MQNVILVALLAKIFLDRSCLVEFLDNRDNRCVSRGMVPLGNCQINVLLYDNSTEESTEIKDYPYDLVGGEFLVIYKG
jgi:hypothetical protein